MSETQDSSNKPITMHNRVEENLVEVTIKKISWERIILHLYCHISYKEGYRPDKPLDFYAVTSFMKANAHMEVTDQGNGDVILSVNVTNPGYCQCLPDSVYHFVACCGDDILAYLYIAPELASKLRDDSRCFLYRNRSRSYAVDFSVSEDEDMSLLLEMCVLNTKKVSLQQYNVPAPDEVQPAQKNSAAQAEDQPKKHRFLKTGKIREMIKKYYQFESGKYDKSYQGKIRTILFMTEQNETLGSNLTSVYNKMVERGLDKDYEILFSARSVVDRRHGSRSWFQLIQKVAHADMIFIDDHCPFLDWLKLSDRTQLIQLWHAGAGFKSSGYSRWGNKGCPGPVSCHRQYKYGISSSNRIAHFHSEVFGINAEQLLPTGMPRMDEYLDPQYRKKAEKKLRKKYPMTVGRKVILFAPTYRGRNKKEAYYPYNMIDFDALYQLCCDKDYVVLFKMHPWVAEPVPIKDEYRDRMADVNAYPNINDLFYITDLLITDYSSNIYEYSLMRKPMLFFAFDKIIYSFSRGFHRPYVESAPGKVCDTFDEVLSAIREEDFQLEKVEEYVKLHFDNIDSNASDRVIDWILLGNVPEENRKMIEARNADNQRLLQMDFSELAAISESDSDDDSGKYDDDSDDTENDRKKSKDDQDDDDDESEDTSSDYD
jgi:CDP-ribitol ribitolphosphotransferase